MNLRSVRVLVLAAIVGAALGSVPRAAAQEDTSNWIPMYELLELPTTNDVAGRAYAVNDTGQVVGYVNSSTKRHSVHWLSEIYTDLHGTVHFNLAHPYELFTEDYSEAFDISNADQIVGTARTLIRCPDVSYIITNPFLLRTAVLSDLGTPFPGDALTNLGTFDSPCDEGYDGAATGISNTNYVVGWSDAPGGVIRAFIIRPVNDVFTNFDPNSGGNTLLIDLGTLGGSDPISSATAVNDLGQVTGYAFTLSNGKAAYRAFLVTPTDSDGDGVLDDWGTIAGNGQNSRMADLGTLGGLNSWGRGVSESGVVVGESDMVAPNGGFFTHAFRYQNGAMLDLGTLAADPTQGNSAAAAVNESGVVVGWAENDARQRRAFVYRDGKMEDLNSLLYLLDDQGVTRLPSITLTEARDINENGVIVGWGVKRNSRDSEDTRPFLLNPILVNPAVFEDPNSVFGDPNAATDPNTGGGQIGNGFNGEPIFGPPGHILGEQDSSASPDTAAPTAPPLCGSSLASMAPGALLGLLAMRFARRF